MKNFDPETLLPEKKPFYKNSKFWLNISFSLFVIIIYIIFHNSYLKDKWTEDELIEAISFSDINSYWKVEQKIDEPDYKGYLVTPEIQFRIFNRSQRPIKQLYLVAVFRFIESGKNIGDTFKMLFSKKSLLPGETSDLITVSSLFGYRTRSLEAFDKSRANWETAMVDIFMRTQNSKLTSIKNFFISKRIRDISETEIRLGQSAQRKK